LLVASFLFSFRFAQAADSPQAWGEWTTWGDQGDGTYRNPVLPADYSDIDCIRVGADYYAISSTMQFSPGMVVLHSKDLVNWTILGHVAGDLTQIGPELNWDKMNRYGRGVWAGAIRYHDKKFWVFFGTPDEGYFMSTAAKPAGPWTPLRQVLKGAGWDDCCPFWDDDGQGYLVGSSFKDKYKIHLWKLTPDGQGLVQESDHVIHQSRGSEANKFFKFNGLYYHLFSEVTAEGRAVMMERSRNIFGPYAEIKQLSHADKRFREPNQGGLVQTETGDWFWFTHHGSGSWEGRPASLVPVKWIDGWPIIGEPDQNGIGHFVLSGKKPVAGAPVATPQTSDEFKERNLSPQWEWNFQPRADKWSLTERPGWLRLHAFRPIQPDSLMKAGNTLTQRAFRTASNVAVIKLDLSGMKDGVKAGLCHFSKSHAALGVSQKDNVRSIEYRNNGVVTPGPAISGNTLWLKSTWGLDGKSRFSYSFNGGSFVEFGAPYQAAWGYYRGDRIGIYAFNDAADSGYIDVDYFHYDFKRQPQEK
jgi:beta-xylosidase